VALASPSGFDNLSIDMPDKLSKWVKAASALAALLRVVAAIIQMMQH
jgi:hypothetical protein